MTCIAACISLGGCCEATSDLIVNAAHEHDCENGNWTGCMELAFQYERGQTPSGKPIEVDEVKAAEYFQRTCDLEPGLCRQYAPYVEHGRGGETADLKRAIELYERACSEGKLSGEACAEAVRIDREQGWGRYDEKTKTLYTKEVCTDPKPRTHHLCRERALLSTPKAPAAVLATKPVIAPTFVLNDGAKISAGTGFFVHPPACDIPLFVTALHLFGPSGGYAKEIPSAKLPERIKSLALRDMIAEKTVYDGVADVVSLPNAKPLGVSPKGGPGDIAAFRMPPRIAPWAIPYAKKPVEFGDVVFLWVPRRVDDHDTLLHRAVVIETPSNSPDFTMIYGRSPSIQATSGAAVLNAKGELVGVNFGGGVETIEDGKPVGYGIATDLRAFGSTLKSAACGE